MEVSPIALFCYNRPIHTQNVLNSLAKNILATDSEVYIFCDGPKKLAKIQELQNIGEVHRIVQNENRFKKVHIFVSTENKGLANSIISGVTSVLAKNPAVIVVEDDLIFSEYFLIYMNESLNMYKNIKEVGSIGSCNFFACGPKFPEIFFIPIADCLGWATWNDRWIKFELDPQKLLHLILKDSKCMFRFNGYGSYDFISMLKDQMNHKVDSWAIRWHAVSILNKWVTLYPNYSLTQHIASHNATHAPVNIKPPIAKRKIKVEKMNVIEVENVIEAMKLGYAGLGDFYGELKTKKNSMLFLKSMRKKLNSSYKILRKFYQNIFWPGNI